MDDSNPEVVAHYFAMTLGEAYAAARADGHTPVSHAPFNRPLEVRILSDAEEAQALADWQDDAEEYLAEMEKEQERGGE